MKKKATDKEILAAGQRIKQAIDRVREELEEDILLTGIAPVSHYLCANKNPNMEIHIAEVVIDAKGNVVKNRFGPVFGLKTISPTGDTEHEGLRNTLLRIKQENQESKQI